jgi:hypothetical protein
MSKFLITRRFQILRNNLDEFLKLKKIKTNLHNNVKKYINLDSN